ncbi:heterokaryon incompatibility protein-domain-containing protein [Hyaloscypha sp. PMI_1271]|nr:heterokaryon incompatibility protein-domain-containing protein [Hyaloscypha sp. PMI_1271]
MSSLGGVKIYYEFPTDNHLRFGLNYDFLPIYARLTLSAAEDPIPLETPQNYAQSTEWPLFLGKQWLEECIANHPECHFMGTSRVYPTRLLELNAPEVGLFRVIYPAAAEEPMTDPYMTLSHCWGSLELLKLETTTYSQLSAGTKISDLPRTFRDAIAVALLFGVKYLWIDFLCIFQDSKDDWSREASLMGDVYRYGLCNIAATAAQDGTGGLFSERQNSKIQDLYVKSTWIDATNMTWRVHMSSFNKLQLLDGPLLSRGWVVQERFLARRILHFGKAQLYWECQRFDACEAYPVGNPKFAGSTPFKSGLNGGMDILAQSPSFPSDLDPKKLEFWHSVLQDYSSCQLTREEDKLVALSGLAKAFQASFAGEEYLAGLWRGSLVTDLCWVLGEPGHRPVKYRAPSWSWASIDGKLFCLGPNAPFEGISMVKILEASVNLRSSDPTGEVTGGFIRLQGNLWTVGHVPGTLSEIGQTSTKYIVNNIISEEFMAADTKIHLQRLHCMPILKQIYSVTEYAECMLVEPTGSKTGQFRRVGMMTMSFEKHHIQSGEVIHNEDWLEFEVDVGGGQYIISII